MLKKKKLIKRKPCMEHKMAFPDENMPEIMGIAYARGRVIVRCPVCGWFVLK